MAGRGERDRAKQVQERCQRLLTELLRDDDNKYCVDCDAKGPRWASWNLGIFLCIRCAGIHRNLGVHISKVKSVNLDSWTPEQVVSLQQMGNSRARAVYEANIPDSFRRPQTDSALEAFVRAKYEHRKYVAREWVPPSPPQVNWDKEIDEEMEKQKKKKKSTSSSLNSSSTSSTEKKSSKQSNVMPKLPKPKSSASPKPGRSTPKRDSGGTADLLGTTKASTDASSHNNLTDDVFSSFLSAPQAPPQDTNKNTTETVKVDDLKSEEESFFNQPAPSEKEKSKMTKDSILALYGQAPMKNVAQFAPSNGFVTAFPQQPYQQAGQINAFSQGFANFPAQAQFAQNGAMPTANPVQPQGFTSGFSQFGGAPAPAPFNNQFNQFQNMQSFQQPLAANNQFQGSPQFQNSNLNGVFPPTAAANGSQAFVGASGNNLSQQFGGMSLGQNNAIPPAMNAAFPNQPSNLTGAFPSTTQQPNIAANGVWP